jgi:hypothetical protein
MHIIRAVGLLAMFLAVPSNCGSSTDKAKGCTGDYYPLGCIGDGRQGSGTATEALSTTSCAGDAYTYFSIRMSFALAASARDSIERCSLDVADQSGRLIGRYWLPFGQTSGGQYYGCAGGLTPSDIGALSYSSCCAANQTLQFTLNALRPDGNVLATGTASGPCIKHGDTPEVPVSLTANLM